MGQRHFHRPGAKELPAAVPETRTRFGSLEFGVAVPDRADPWTRMCYAGPNKPVAPIEDPNQMLAKLYGQMKDKESLVSILDDVRDDLQRVSKQLSAEDRSLLDEHPTAWPARPNRGRTAACSTTRSSSG